MRALEFREFGPPSVLKLVERPDPAVTPSTAVIRVNAASINPSDVKNVSGNMEGTVLPRVPGRDFSGTVLQGPKEWIGAEIWGTGGDVGFTIDGSYATHMLIPVAALVRKPRNLSHDEAASIGVNFIVAWLGAVTYGDIRAGETLAVVGAGGGVGGAVTQIAKAKGLRVIGVDRAPLPKDSPASKLIDDFVNSTSPDWPQEIGRLTQGKGADIVFDSVGGIMFEPALLSLGHHGRLIEISSTGKRRVDFDVVDFYHKELKIIGADSRKLDVVASSRLMTDLVAGFEQGHYQPPIVAARYPLEKAQDAYAAVEKGTAGKVVLTP
jgi:NADPH:quinone reductase-like Zn-dependent oxidoreductase